MSANTIQVVVPEGVSEGQVFVVQLSNGQTLSVTCPRGAYPGTTLSVTGGQSLFARAFREDSSESKNSTETKYHHREDIVTWIDSRSYGSPYDERVYTWNRIPDSEAEFRAAKRLLCRTPQGAACLLSMATLIYCNPRTTKLGEICMRLSIHPDVNFSRALRDFSSRMKSDPSIAASYIQGTRPGNRYALPSTLTCKIRTQHVDVRAGRHKVFVYSTGADTPRPITMKATASGEFLAKEFSSLMVEVCPSGIFRHFKEKRSKDVLRRIATVQVDRFMNELIACSSLSSSDVERRIRPLLHSTVSWRHQSYVVVVVVVVVVLSFMIIITSLSLSSHLSIHLKHAPHLDNRYAIQKALKSVSLYATNPIVVTRFEVESHSRPQTLGVKKDGTLVQGTRVRLWVAKRPGVDGLPAPLHLFFPINGSAPSLINVGSL